jgi:hypothetical protein
MSSARSIAAAPPFAVDLAADADADVVAETPGTVRARCGITRAGAPAGAFAGAIAAVAPVVRRRVGAYVETTRGATDGGAETSGGPALPWVTVAAAGSSASPRATAAAAGAASPRAAAA